MNKPKRPASLAPARGWQTNQGQSNMTISKQLEIAAAYKKMGKLNLVRQALGNYQLAEQLNEANQKNHAIIIEQIDDIRVLENIANMVIQACFDEANRLANHCHDSAAEWAANNLYNAANKARQAMNYRAKNDAPAESANEKLCREAGQKTQ
jgi:hypothetical protein